MQVQNVQYNYNPYQQQYSYSYRNLQNPQQYNIYPSYTYQFYQPQSSQVQHRPFGIIETARYLCPPPPEKPFNYRQDELPYVNNPQKSLEDYLLEKKDYCRLIEYQDKLYNKNDFQLIGKYLSTPDFKELAQNKCFSGMFGFDKLTDIVKELEKKQREAYQIIHNPQYRPCVIPDMNAIYAGCDVGNAIKNINKFFNSNFSEDLKQYILKETDNFENLYWVSVNLAYLDKDKPNVDDLSSFRYPVL